jgi:protein phosphatase
MIRTSNEDSFAVNLKNRLFLVADGMGGHAGGEIASSMAVDALQECVAGSDSDENPEESLRLAAQEANSRVYQKQLQNPDLAGMGSTLTALSIRGQKFYIAHVGDSRAYRLRGGQLEQLTRDHSLVWHLFENGVLRKKDLSTHPQKNLITRSIGPHPEVDIDLEQGEAREGDVFLLCSDGLTDVISDEGIGEALADTGRTPQQLGEDFVNSANEAGGPDNVTVVIVRLEQGETDDENTGKFLAR